MPLINLGYVDNFSSEIFLGMLGIEPTTAGSGNKYTNHCALMPPIHTLYVWDTIASWWFRELKFLVQTDQVLGNLFFEQ